MKTPLFALLALATGAVLHSAARADDIRWTSEIDGLYHHAPNWSPATVPGADDRAIFDAGGALSVFVITDAVNDALIVGRGTVTFELGGNTYAPGLLTIGGPVNFASVIVTGGGIFTPEFTGLGSAGRAGFLTIRGGSALEGGSVIVGDDESPGVLNVTDGSTASIGGLQVYAGSVAGVNDGAVMDVSGLIDIGALAQPGDGVLEVIGGGDVSAETILVGLSVGSTNRMTVSGPESRVTAAGALEIGRRGGATTTVTDGATVRAGELTIGSTADDTGHLTIDAATVRADETTILGTGRLTLLTQADLEGDAEMRNFGVIDGDGQIRVPLRNKGVMRPGGIGGIGALRVPQAYFIQEGGGVLEIEIDGNNRYHVDRLRVRGDAALGGTLDARPIDGYEPVHGRRYNVLLITLEGGTLAGEFETVLPADTWNVLYEDTGVYLTPLDGACPDLDGSGDISFGDLLVVLGDWGPCVGCPGDVDGNEVVDFQDLLVLLGVWGPCV